MLPLNGKRTHPLSPLAKACLSQIEKGPVPAQDLNPGVVNRLLREGTVELVTLPSPYPTVNKSVPHLRMKTGN